MASRRILGLLFVILAGGALDAGDAVSTLTCEETVDGVLMAAPIVARALELTGPAVPVVEGLWVSAAGDVDYQVSESGTLIYASGGGGLDGNRAEPAWASRDGEMEVVDPDWVVPTGFGFGQVL